MKLVELNLMQTKGGKGTISTWKDEKNQLQSPYLSNNKNLLPSEAV